MSRRCLLSSHYKTPSFYSAETGNISFPILRAYSLMGNFLLGVHCQDHIIHKQHLADTFVLAWRSVRLNRPSSLFEWKNILVSSWAECIEEHQGKTFGAITQPCFTPTSIYPQCQEYFVYSLINNKTVPALKLTIYKTRHKSKMNWEAEGGKTLISGTSS